MFKIADIKQTESEKVINCFGRGLSTVTVTDVKANIDVARYVVPDLEPSQHHSKQLYKPTMIEKILVL